jgi:hypothetical protein
MAGSPVSRLAYNLAGKKKSPISAKLFVTMLLLILTNFSAFMVIIPFESDTLRFISSNGLTNLLLITLSFLFAPVLPMFNTEQEEVDDERQGTGSGGKLTTEVEQEMQDLT